MQSRIVEFFLHLLPYMAEEIFTFLDRLIFKVSGERNALGGIVVSAHPSDGGSVADVDVLAVP